MNTPLAKEGLLKLLCTRKLDGFTSKEAAEKVGCSVPMVIKILLALELNNFTANDGASLMHTGTDTMRRGQQTDGSPTKYFWFFQ